MSQRPGPLGRARSALRPRMTLCSGWWAGRTRPNGVVEGVRRAKTRPQQPSTAQVQGRQPWPGALARVVRGSSSR